MRQKIAKVTTDGGELRFHFEGWEKPEVVDPAGLSEEIREQAMLHGLKQKLQDAYAGASGPREARERFMAVLDALRGGAWNRRANGGGAAALVVEAIARVMGMEVDAARKRWEGLDAATQKAVKADPRIKKAVYEIRLERMGSAEGGESKLGALLGEG